MVIRGTDQGREEGKVISGWLPLSLSDSTIPLVGLSKVHPHPFHVAVPAPKVYLHIDIRRASVSEREGGGIWKWMEREMYHRLTLHPSFPLLMASPSVTSASLMIDLKGDEKTPHLHLTPSSFIEGDIYIFDPFRDGSPSPSNGQKCASRRSRSGKDNEKSGKIKMRDDASTTI